MATNRRVPDNRVSWGRCALCSQAVHADDGVKLTSVEGDWIAFHRAGCAARAGSELARFAAGTRMPGAVIEADRDALTG